jgi:type I restriction-modification system DNA methylase subunit
MTDDSRVSAYADAIKQQFVSGHAREHAYRPALERLMDGFEDVTAVNDPKRSQHGNPDFVFVKQSNKDITFGYAEAKDITIDLAKTVKTEQLRRYAGYEKLFLTNYLDFRFFRNGEQYEELSIGKIKNGELVFNVNEFARLEDVLQEFLNQPPETIRSGKRLALIMGGKARRIRTNVAIYLDNEDNEQNAELEKIFQMMKELLVHDLTPAKFADMYAQTLVYGLFVARYNDKTSSSFNRREARDLVPSSNPFLREFFDHIVGPRFDRRLSHIVDELCEAFGASDVHMLVQKHLRLFEVGNYKDPIIHFYEDFLKEYDPEERKKMGAYYTPVPVVRFIIKQVDEILKKDFDIAKGLADTSKIEHSTTDSGGKKYKFLTHKVQILDPAVGTATFLNEIIKYIYKGFEGQEGRWPAYAEQDLLPRLYGFELMMAPYTIAHLKLGMTLQETGIKEFKNRLGVYLTNTLEEGVKHQQDLFTFGLAQAVSDEAEEAAKIKHEKPVMVVIGNPPYAVESSNQTDYATELVKKYKYEPGGTQKLQERNSKMINDDYVKFIAFAEDMITRNGIGVVAMITNHGYLDNPTFRGMRWRLTKTFDSIYVLDLHGNSKKKEVAPDGSKDENVFDIQQGVSIIFGVKNGIKRSNQLAKVYRQDVFGSRRRKFEQLSEGNVEWSEIVPDKRFNLFTKRDNTDFKDYDNYVSLDDLFLINAAGIKTSRDNFVIDKDKRKLSRRIQEFCDLQDVDDETIKAKYELKEAAGWTVHGARHAIKAFDPDKIVKIAYRPFDTRWTYWDSAVNTRMREKVMKNLLHSNIALITVRQVAEDSGFNHVFISDDIVEGRMTLSNKGICFVYPLYIYHDDETPVPNFKPEALKQLTKNLKDSYAPEDILNYLYAVLHSFEYRKKYKEFLKTDFPRIPAPKSDTQFNMLIKLGKQLHELHLMTSPLLNNLITTFPVPDTNEVDNMYYADDKVWINSTQYFGNIDSAAWNFSISGYQPAQKWLKDRRGQKLSSGEIEHYQKIIKALVETEKTMKEINNV